MFDIRLLGQPIRNVNVDAGFLPDFSDKLVSNSAFTFYARVCGKTSLTECVLELCYDGLNRCPRMAVPVWILTGIRREKDARTGR